MGHGERGTLGLVQAMERQFGYMIPHHPLGTERGPLRGDEQNLMTDQLSEETDRQVLRRRIDPVHILEQHQNRPLLGELQRVPDQGRPQPLAARRRRLVGQSGAAVDIQ